MRGLKRTNHRKKPGVLLLDYPDDAGPTVQGFRWTVNPEFNPCRCWRALWRESCGCGEVKNHCNANPYTQKREPC